MKKPVALILLLVLSTGLISIQAQEVLLNEVVDDTTQEEYGPNGKKFFHTQFGLGFIFGNDEGANGAIEYGNSYNINIGFRYWYRLANFYAIGADLDYQFDSYRRDQSVLQKEYIQFNYLDADIFNRFQFKRQTGKLGIYLDLGAYGGWMFQARHYQERDLSGITNTAEEQQIINKKLNYVHPYNYGVMARFGINSFALNARYRFSDLYSSNVLFDEMPRLTIGLELKGF